MRVVAGIGIALIFIPPFSSLSVFRRFVERKLAAFVRRSIIIEIYDEENVKAARIADILRLANVILNGDWSAV